MPESPADRLRNFRSGDLPQPPSRSMKRRPGTPSRVEPHSSGQYLRRYGPGLRRSTSQQQTPAGNVPSSSPSRAFAGFISQTVVLTAILYYFGWVQVLATYNYFGVDVSVLNFSIPDYVLRSISTAFPLLIAAAFIALAAMIPHSLLQPKLAASCQFAKQLGWIMVGTGSGLAVIGLLLSLTVTGLAGPALPGPIVLLIGFAIATYGFALLNRYVYHSGSRLTVILGVLAFLPVLLTVNAYGHFAGVRYAERLQAALAKDPNVIVYSSSDLALSGPGITESVLFSPGGYRYRYSGLRLLVSSNDQYFLLPARWRQGNGSLIVLPFAPPGANIRVEFQAQKS